MLAMCVSMLASCSDGGSEDPANPTAKPEVVTPDITIDGDVLTNGLAFGTEAGETTLTFSTNVDWTLSIASTAGGTAWCKASISSGSKGSATVKFTVTEHTDYDDRSVSVTIKAGTASKTFTITQKCIDALLLTTDKYEVGQDGGTIEVEVKANIDYEVAISETAKSWISTSESKSRALTTYKHTFKIAASEETEKREGEITFKSGDKVETVKVYQAGGPIILLTKDEYSVSDKGETITVDLKSNIEYGVQMPDVDWISAENQTRAMSSHTLKYVVAPNEGYDSRSAQIVFYDKNSDLKDTLTVVQAQKDAIIISQKEYTIDSEGETIEVKLSANVEFEVTMPQVNWISKVESRALTEYTLLFNIAENTNYDNRNAEIVFTNNDTQLSEKITITQLKASLLQLTQDEFTISDAGETISVELKSNVEYGIQMPEVDWITQETLERSVSAETMKFVIAPNEGYDKRSVEIIFYDKNSALKDTLKVIQAQKNAIIISQKEYTIHSEGETIEVKLSANVEFEVTMPKVDWVSKVKSRALKSHTLYFKIAEATNKNYRNAEIIVKDKNSDLRDTIYITQKYLIYHEVGVNSVNIKSRMLFQNQIYGINWAKWIENYISTTQISTPINFQWINNTGNNYILNDGTIIAIGDTATISWTKTIEELEGAPNGKLYVFNIYVVDHATYDTPNESYLFVDSKFKGDYNFIDATTSIIEGKSELTAQKVVLPINKTELIGELVLTSPNYCVVECVNGAPQLGVPADFSSLKVRYLVKNICYRPIGVPQATRLYEIRITYLPGNLN